MDCCNALATEAGSSELPTVHIQRTRLDRQQNLLLLRLFRYSRCLEAHTASKVSKRMMHSGVYQVSLATFVCAEEYDGSRKRAEKRRGHTTV